MLNPYSFYQLYQTKYGQKYLNNIINSIICSNEKYNLLDFYNYSINHVRSYVIFESNNNIIFIDFNVDNKKINDDLTIIRFLKINNFKKVSFIILNNWDGINYLDKDIYYIYKTNNFLFADTYDVQLKLNNKLTKILYSMNKEILKLYLHEEEISN